jgi:hypothetical protein
VDDLGELGHAHLALVAAGEPVEHLVLDRGQVVLAPQLVLQRGMDGGVGGVQGAPGLDRVRCRLELRHGAHCTRCMRVN